MNNILTTILTFVAATLCMSGVMKAQPVPHVTSMEEAQQWCDGNNLDPVEGVWQMTEENVLVLVARNSFLNMADYTITVVDCFDAMTEPGETVGQLKPTADARKYKLRLTTRRDSRTGAPAGFEECDATLDADTYAMILKPRKNKFKISFHPTMLFPRLWRLISIRRTEGDDTQCKGMVKVYPSYDGNGSSRRSPRYL